MNNMYTVLKSVIENRNYELGDMLDKIKVFWAQGDVTKEEHKELITLAQNNANYINGIDVLAKLEELDRRVKALEDKKTDEDVSNEESEDVTYPEYVPGKWYYNGDKVTFDGKNHVCTAPEGVVCVWSPADYPAYWSEYKQ